ncbi:Anaerobic dimethyl sulfoxide reductase chain C, anchor subunit [hydrothermal vent metagenome]|uniref:Anaerobic dimethyl sulfoxide reductase chain C, anchor subunit n=1 Tax=hydrothermal vent metagenome TaxID=652676 RepID=A0A3B0RDC5_9ZZZZ
MHPAKSVIFFTTTTGAGYGLLFWLAVLGYRGLIGPDFWFGLVAFGLAFLLVVAGLLSSTLHLGHPERAWRALSQWRSSWLSREGVMAVLTFIPTGLYALAWVALHNNAGPFALLGLVGGVFSLLTVYTTSMIYASLKAIPAWSIGWTSPGYLVLSLMSGAVLASALAILGGYGTAASWLMLPTLFFLAFALVIKLSYWSKLDGPIASTTETATGLGEFGKTRLIESPHDQPNYLLKEMGFSIARKHSTKLRRLVIAFGFVLPFILVAAIWFLPAFSAMFLVSATISCAIGVVTERWLFFAEAKHVVTLYYDV